MPVEASLTRLPPDMLNVLMPAALKLSAPMPIVPAPFASTVEFVSATVPGAGLNATPAPPPDVLKLRESPLMVPPPSTGKPTELVPVVVMILLVILTIPPFAASTPVAKLFDATLMVVPVLLIVPPGAKRPAVGEPPDTPKAPFTCPFAVTMLAVRREYAVWFCSALILMVFCTVSVPMLHDSALTPAAAFGDVSDTMAIDRVPPLTANIPVLPACPATPTPLRLIVRPSPMVPSGTVVLSTTMPTLLVPFRLRVEPASNETRPPSCM